MSAAPDDEVQRFIDFDAQIAAWVLRYRRRLAERLGVDFMSEGAQWLREYPTPDEIDVDESAEDAADEELTYWSNDG